MGNLKIGYVLPIWGEGRNPPTKEAKKFIQDIFNQGQLSKPVPPAESVIMMQEKVYAITKEPIFDENTFLDEDQIKSMFGSISRPRKRSVSGSRKPATTSATQSVGIDYDDDDNGEEKQAFEEASADVEAVGINVAHDQDADEIERVLANDNTESDQHPIMVAGEELCTIAERIDFGLSVAPVLAKLSKEKKDAIWEKIDQEDSAMEPQRKKRRTTKQLEKSIFQYIKKHCNCVAFARYGPN